MNTLKITNKGLIVNEDLMLIGSSTKRDDSTKIGMFGSGWKYALAWLLRNEIDIKIFSGKNKIKISKEIVLHRDNPVNVITINDVKTSLTTEMGPKWTAWMALREIISNAIDEGDHTISMLFNPEYDSADDITSIYLPMNGELSDVMLNYTRYFSFQRKPDFEYLDGKMFFKKQPDYLNIYRKGIRCYDSTKKSMIDWDFGKIPISEDRLISYWDYENYAKSFLKNCSLPIHQWEFVLDNLDFDLLPKHNQYIIDIMTELAKTRDITCVAAKDFGGKLLTKEGAICIPNEWYKELEKLGVVKGIFDISNDNFNFIQTGNKDISNISNYLNKFNVIDVIILSGKCTKDVALTGNTVYIKDDTLKSDKDLAALIIQNLPLSYYVDKMY